jgi:RimJ/RimL family protein N-acetyltransferase
MDIYLDIYKANADIFTKIPVLHLNDSIEIRGIHPNYIDAEAKYYLLNSNDELIKKYLPGAFVETIDESIEKIYEFAKRFVLRSSILFCIASKETHVPVGYILCNSPLSSFQNSNEKINEWLIDFWLNKEQRGRGLMYASIYTVCNYLKQMEVPALYAYSDKINLDSIKVLQKSQFILHGETIDRKMYKFGVILNRGNK